MSSRRLSASTSAVASIALVAVGCNYLMVADNLVGPSAATSDFQAQTNLALDDASRIVVVCHTTPKVAAAHHDLRQQLARTVTLRLEQHGAPVHDSAVVAAWLQAHPDWQQQQHIGKELGADFVINLDLHSYRQGVQPLKSPVAGVIFEPDPHSPVKNHPDDAAQNLRTEATVTVTVVRVGGENPGETIYCKNVTVSHRELEALDAEAMHKSVRTALTRHVALLFTPHSDDKPSHPDYTVRLSSCSTVK